MHRCWLHRHFLKAEKEHLSEKQISDTKQFYVASKGRMILEHSGDPYHEVLLPSLEGDLARSSLFGHEKGAFTGAERSKEGFLSDKDVTDVLLDEIGYASIEMQRNLLQVIQSGTFYKLGSTRQQTTTSRLFFATNQDLPRLIKERKFQEDLWWRITDHVLYIPALREQRSEIRTIADGILETLNQAHIGTPDRSGFLHFAKEDYLWADAHDWPGNIRELEKTVRRWFFYRGTRRLKEVWMQIAPFVPRNSRSDEPCIEFVESRTRAVLQTKLSAAIAGKETLLTPDRMVEDLLDPTRKMVSQSLASCLEELAPSNEQLSLLFKNHKPASTRSWRSRNRGLS